MGCTEFNIRTKARLPHRGRGGAPTAVELYAGAGLFGYAFKAAGFKLQAAYERDPIAASTYARNLGPHVHVCDLLHQKPVGKADVLIAGPPCQGFSSLGPRDPCDPRNALPVIIAEWAHTLGARVAVVENVAPFLKSDSWVKMFRAFQRLGYTAHPFLVNAAEFGAPQRRHRSLTFFTKMSATPTLHAVCGTERSSVRTAFADLPPYPCRSIQHFTLPRTEYALRRIQLVPQGGDVRDIARAKRHLVAPSWFRTRGKIIDIWGRMRWDDLSPTIRTGFLNPSRGRFLHPEEDRPISFREAARLQMVPDDFLFEGKPEQMARQIGNGVPLGIGLAAAAAVAKMLGEC